MKILLKRFFFLLVVFVTPTACRGSWETGVSNFNFRNYVLREVNDDVRRVARSAAESYDSFVAPDEIKHVPEAAAIPLPAVPSPERNVESLAEQPEHVAKVPMRNIDSEKPIESSNISDVSLPEPSKENLPNPLSDVSGTRNAYRMHYGYKRNDNGVERMPELVEQNGYPLETHTIETKDGKSLTVHRVRKKNFLKRNTRVALVWHGLMGSSADFFIGGPEYALGYLLANSNFDVWLANQRGNFYSQNIVSSNFWNFSIHEIGKYDVPACIDYIINATGVQKLFAISHSTGAAAFLIALNERGIYQSKLHGLVAMAPCTTIQFSPSKLMQLLMRTYGLLKPQILEKFIGKEEVKTSETLLDSLVTSFCEGVGVEPFCDNILFMLTGYPKRTLSATPELINFNTPSGTSAKTLIHLAQMSLTGEFQAFDYGEEMNQDIYGHSWPNDYIIDKLMTRVIFFSSRDDEFVSDQDISALSKQISRLQVKVKVKAPNFGHSDFLFAKDARDHVYERLIQEINTLE